MLAAGALDEVRALAALGLSSELPIMRALGVAPLAAHLAGRVPLEAAVEAAKAETRQYAKRQLTWLRRNMIVVEAHRYARNGKNRARKIWHLVTLAVDPPGCYPY